MPGLAPLAIWFLTVALIVIALVHALRHPWQGDEGIPRWTRIAVPLVIAALAIAVLTWVVMVRR